MTHLPALGRPTGPDDRRARFFGEMAGAMEFMALYFSLSAEKQLELQQHMQSLAAEASKKGRA